MVKRKWRWYQGRLSHVEALARAREALERFPDLSDREIARVADRRLITIRRWMDRGLIVGVRTPSSKEGRESARDYLGKHPDATNREIARAVGRDKNTIRQWFVGGCLVRK